MKIDNIVTINVAQIAGKSITDIGAPYLDAQFTPGAELPYRASTWLNIAGGIALELVGYKFLEGNAKLGAVVVGSHMVSKVVNYAEETLTIPATRMVRISNVRPVLQRPVVAAATTTTASRPYGVLATPVAVF